MCEHSFMLAVPKLITESRSKFNYIVANLSPERALIVRDFIPIPSETKPYEELKPFLIKIN